MTNIPTDDAEMNKLLLSVLRQNPATLLVFDNCVGAVGTPALDMCLTSQFYRSRLLGVNQEITIFHTLTVIATGNNIYVCGDTARRTYWIKLQPEQAPQFTNRVFKHVGLDQWAMEHRLEILQHLLTMCRAWHIAGRPAPKRVPRIQSFENWSQLVGGILEFSGIESFLSTFQADADMAAPEQTDWAAFLVQLHATRGEKEFTAGELTSNLREENVRYKPVSEAAPKAVLEALEKNLVASKLIGGLLLEQCERIHRVSDEETGCSFDFKLMEAGMIRTGARKFRVLRRELGKAWSFATKTKGAAAE